MSPESNPTPERIETSKARAGSIAKSVLAVMGSLKLAIPLLATVACVIAAATIVEARRGRPYAQWYIYHSPWFAALLGLLAANIFCAAAVRWPWKRHQTGFVVTHCGLLILLFGSVLTFLGGIEGQVRLAEGQTATRMIVPQQSQIALAWTGRENEPPYEFVFEPGPVNWREGKTLDLGNVDGVHAKVLHYYQHAKVVEDWLPDPSGAGGPQLRFTIAGPDGSETSPQLLVDQGFGDEVEFGPIRLQIQQALNSAMLADFQAPPTPRAGSKGMLVAYFGNQSKRLDVDSSLGKETKLGEGISIKLVNYFANARPDAPGGFKSAGESPTNPMLEILVHLPGNDQPLQQVTFAKDPLLSLDPAFGRSTPVRFRYYHPAVRPMTAVEFMQAEDGALYCRTWSANRVSQRGKVALGQRIEMPGNYVFKVVEHQPHVRQMISFVPTRRSDSGQEEQDDAAAEVEIRAGGVTRTVWLQRNHPVLGQRVLSTNDGPLHIRLGHGERSLGFALKLLRFHREVNPGGVGNAAFSSRVSVKDEARGIEGERLISMNKPLTYRGLTFYQASFDDDGHGVNSSTLNVGYDPGRILKYGGSLLICLGIAIMFYMRAYFFKKPGSGSDGRPSHLPRSEVFARGDSAASSPTAGADSPTSPVLVDALTPNESPMSNLVIDPAGSQE